MSFSPLFGGFPLIQDFFFVTKSVALAGGGEFRRPQKPKKSYYHFDPHK